MNNRESRDRDRPLGFHWRVSGEATASLNLSPARNDRFEAARNSILAEAFLAGEEGKRVSYSRSKGFYANQQRYRGTAYSYSNVTGSVAELSGIGWLDEWRVAPGSDREWQSTFAATDELMEVWGAADVGLTPIDRECIRLRGVDGKLVDYEDTDRTRRMRRDLTAVNSDMQSIAVDIASPVVVKTLYLWEIPGENGPAFVRPRSPYLHRMFCRGSFRYGGRAYGWWQSIPRAHRPLLTINDEPVVECDYASLHPSCMRNATWHSTATPTMSMGFRANKQSSASILASTHRRRARGSAPSQTR